MAVAGSGSGSSSRKCSDRKWWEGLCNDEVEEEQVHEQEVAQEEEFGLVCGTQQSGEHDTGRGEREKKGDSVV